MLLPGSQIFLTSEWLNAGVGTNNKLAELIEGDSMGKTIRNVIQCATKLSVLYNEDKCA